MIGCINTGAITQTSEMFTCMYKGTKVYIYNTAENHNHYLQAG